MPARVVLTLWLSAALVCAAGSAQAQHSISSVVADDRDVPLEGVRGGIVGPATDEIFYETFMPMVFDAIPFMQSVVTDATGTFTFSIYRRAATSSPSSLQVSARYAVTSPCPSSLQSTSHKWRL